MTEELWSHALKFLDKYRKDEKNYDIEELYQFADQTGILERHKQLLAQPFHEDQVDMKIMYYELIKMLIDFERGNKPEAWDSTKNVGKIEGYQELTNKLQRYLNHRFMLDADRVKGQEDTIKAVDKKTETMAQRCDRLEARLETLSSSHGQLREEYSKLEKNNREILERLDSGANRLSAERTADQDLSHKILETTTNLLETDNEYEQEAGHADIKDLKSRIQSINNKLTEVEVVKQKLVHIESARVSGQDKLAALDILKEKFADMEALKTRITDLEQVQTLTPDANKLKTRLSNLEAANLKYACLEDVRNKVVRDNLTEMEVVKTRLTEIELEPKKLHDRVQDLEKTSKQLSYLESARAAEIGKSQSKDGVLSKTLQQQLSQMEEIKVKVDDLEHMKKRVSSIDGRLANAELTNHRLKDLDDIIKRVSVLEGVTNHLQEVKCEGSALDEKFYSLGNMIQANCQTVQEHSAKCAETKEITKRLENITNLHQNETQKIQLRIEMNEERASACKSHQEDFKKSLERLEEKVKNNSSDINTNACLTKQNTEGLNILQVVQERVKKEIIEFDRNTEKCMRSVQKAEKEMKDSSRDINNLVSINCSDILSLNENMFHLQQAVDNAKPEVKDNCQQIQDILKTSTENSENVNKRMSAIEKDMSHITLLANQYQASQQLSIQFTSLEEKCRDLRGEVDNINQRLKNKSENFKIVSKEMVDWQNRMEEENTMYFKKMKNFQDVDERVITLEQFQEKNKDAIMQYSELNKSVNELTIHMERLQSSIVKQDKELNGLDCLNIQLNSFKESMKNVTEGVEDLTKRIDGICEKSKIQASCIDEVASQRNTLTIMNEVQNVHVVKLAELEKLQQRMNLLEEFLRKSETKGDEIQTTLASVNNISCALEKLQTSMVLKQDKLESTLEIDKVHSKLKDLAEELKSISTQIEKEVVEKNQLKQDIAGVTNIVVKINHGISATSKNLNSINDMAQEVGIFKEQLEIEKECNMKFQKDVTDSFTKINQDLEDNNMNMRNHLQKSIDGIKEKMKSLNNHQHEDTNKMVSLHEKIEALQNLSDEHKNKLTKLQDLDTCVASLTALVEKMGSKVETLIGRMKIVDGHLGEVEQIKKWQQDVNQSISSINVAMSQQSDSFASLQNEHTMHEQTAESTEDLREKMASTISQQYEIQQHFKTLQEQFEMLENSSIEKDKVLTRLQDLETWVTSLKAPVETMGSRVDILAERMKTVNDQIGKIEKEKLQLQEDTMESLSSIHDKLRDQNNSQCLNSLQKHVDLLQKSTKENYEELRKVKELSCTVASNTDQYEKIESRMEDLATQFLKLREQINMVNQDTLLLQNNLSNITETVSKTNQSLSETSEKFGQLDEKLKNEVTGKKQLQQDIAGVTETVIKINSILTETSESWTKLEHVADQLELERTGRMLLQQEISCANNNNNKTNQRLSENTEILDQLEKKVFDQEAKIIDLETKNADHVKFDITHMNHILSEKLEGLTCLQKDMFNISKHVEQMESKQFMEVKIVESFEEIQTKLNDIKYLKQQCQEIIRRDEEHLESLESTQNEIRQLKVSNQEQDNNKVRMDAIDIQVNSLTILVDQIGKETKNNDEAIITIEKHIKKETDLREKLKTGIEDNLDGLKEQLLTQVKQKEAAMKKELQENQKFFEKITQGVAHLSRTHEETENKQDIQMIQLVNKIESALNEIVQNKTKLQEIYSKIEKLEVQKQNSNVQSLISAANSTLIKGLQANTEKIQELDTHLASTQREMADLQLINKNGDDQINTEINDMLATLEVYKVELEANCEKIHMQEKELVHMKETTRTIERIQSENNNKSFLKDMEDKKLLFEKVIGLEKELYTQGESMKQDKNNTEVSNNNIVLKLNSLEKEYENKHDLKHLTEKIGSIETEHGNLKTYIVKERAEAVANFEAFKKDSTNKFNKIDKQLKKTPEAVDGISVKLSLLEMEWANYMNAHSVDKASIDLLEEQQRTTNETIECLKKNIAEADDKRFNNDFMRSVKDIQSSSLQKHTVELSKVVCNQAEQGEIIASLQKQINETELVKDNSGIEDLRTFIEESKSELKQHRQTVEELLDEQSRQNERQNETAVRMTQMSLMTSNISDKLVLQPSDSDLSRIEEIEQWLDDTNKAIKTIKTDGSCQKDRIEMLETVIKETNEMGLTNETSEKIKSLEDCYKECATTLKLIENTRDNQFVKKHDDKSDLGSKVEEQIQSRQNYSEMPQTEKELSCHTLHKMVLTLESEVSELRGTIAKTDINMKKILEQTNLLLLKDASQEEKTSKTERYQVVLEKKQNELESADVFLQEAHRLLTEKVVLLEGRINQLGESQNLEYKHLTGSEYVTSDVLTKTNEELIELRKKLLTIESIQVDNMTKMDHLTSVEMCPELFSRLYNLETKEMESGAKIDSLLTTNESIANTFIKIKEDFKQTQSLTQQIQAMNIKSKDPDTFLNEVTDNFLELDMKLENQGKSISILDNSVLSLTEQSNKTTKEIVRQDSDIRNIQKDMKTDQNLMIIRFNTHKDTVEKIIKKVEDRVGKVESTQLEKFGQLEILEKRASEYEGIYSQLEVRQGKLEEASLGDEGKGSKDDIKNIRCDLASTREQLAGVLAELCSTFGGYTVVLKSEGEIGNNQADILGVYRMADSHCDRPVYKQDGGENYIYYSDASDSWLVGTVVGHQYAWLRNCTEKAPDTRWVPELRVGWEYRSRDSQSGAWSNRDPTLRIEQLPDVERVSKIVKNFQDLA